MAAVRQNGAALEDASDELASRTDVVLLALAIGIALPQLQHSRTVLPHLLRPHRHHHHHQSLHPT